MAIPLDNLTHLSAMDSRLTAQCDCLKDNKRWDCPYNDACSHRSCSQLCQRSHVSKCYSSTARIIYDPGQNELGLEDIRNISNLTTDWCLILLVTCVLENRCSDDNCPLPHHPASKFAKLFAERSALPHTNELALCAGICSNLITTTTGEKCPAEDITAILATLGCPQIKSMLLWNLQQKHNFNTIEMEETVLKLRTDSKLWTTLEEMLSDHLEELSLAVIQVPPIACFSIGRKFMKTHVQVPIRLFVTDFAGRVELRLYLVLCQTTVKAKKLTKLYIAHPILGDMLYSGNGRPKRVQAGWLVHNVCCENVVCVVYRRVKLSNLLPPHPLLHEKAPELRAAYSAADALYCRPARLKLKDWFTQHPKHNSCGVYGVYYMFTKFATDPTSWQQPSTTTDSARADWEKKGRERIFWAIVYDDVKYLNDSEFAIQTQSEDSKKAFLEKSYFCENKRVSGMLLCALLKNGEFISDQIINYVLELLRNKFCDNRSQVCLFGTTALETLSTLGKSFSRFSSAVASAKEVALCFCVRSHFFCIEAHLNQFRSLGVVVEGTLVDSMPWHNKQTRLQTFQEIAKHIQEEVASQQGHLTVPAPTSSCKVLEAERPNSDTRCFSNPFGLQSWWSGSRIDKAAGLGSCKLLLTRGDSTPNHDGIGFLSRLPQHLASATKRCTTKTCTLTLKNHTTGKAMYLSKGGIHAGDVFASVGEGSTTASCESESCKKQETCNLSVNANVSLQIQSSTSCGDRDRETKSAFGTTPLWIRIVCQRGTI